MNRLVLLRASVSLVGLVAIGVHLVWPKLAIDAVTLGMLLISLLPWLQPLIKSIEISGIGKVELQDLKDDIAKAKGAAESAAQQAEVALLSTSRTTEAVSTSITYPNATASINALADEYDQIREQDTSGDARTVKMTDVVHRMIDAAPRSKLDVAAALRSERRGQRLAAYAFLFSRPESQFVNELIDSVANIEDKPFGAYWGLKAIEASLNEGRVPPDVRGKLKGLLGRYPVGSDRDYQLKRILAQFQTVA